ncbi:hypothetical protein [Caballeronia cordobensis]|uniref:Uncharacterized protein n=1 Tax=Caballeronia cordobensis TaxID=1353886 RepID=A0A158HA62_CABCO|nr:hypothetical protein [Caballeronia cordobensis]BAO88504.1 uncharacterized protein BRPE67_BCDS05900 [Burkholderia sp. RPE67]SAL41208.1 hypothetical protein AWB70_03109 [Caballeronia cordobensis]
MSADQRAQEELAHIGRMIAELERVATSRRAAPMRPAVMRQEYWQRRIDALLGACPNEPLRRDAAALRERLADVFAEAHERDTGHAEERVARETGGRK